MSSDPNMILFFKFPKSPKSRPCTTSFLQQNVPFRPILVSLVIVHRHFYEVQFHMFVVIMKQNHNNWVSDSQIHHTCRCQNLFCRTLREYARKRHAPYPLSLFKRTMSWETNSPSHNVTTLANIKQLRRKFSGEELTQ